MDIQITVDPTPNQFGDSCVVQVEGEIDVYTSSRFGHVVTQLIEAGTFDRGQRLIINLDRVHYIDSTGIGQLIGALKRLRERCQEADLWLIMDGCPLIRKHFEYIRIDKLFKIVTAKELNASVQQAPTPSKNAAAATKRAGVS